REIFAYDYPEIARWVDKNEAACRQIFSRAKRHLVEHRPRFTLSADEQARLLSAFITACTDGDLHGLTALLADDVSSWTDAGGKASAATRPLYGSNIVARFIIGLFNRVPADMRYELREFNGVLS